MGVITVIALIAAIVIYYIRIQDPLWQERREYRERALAETNLTSINRIDRFVTDEAAVVVSGKDGDGLPLYVYFGEGEPRTFVAVDTVSSEDVVEKVKEKHSGAVVLRTAPGIWDDEWVWEVFYKVRTEQGTRHFYDYYRMADGEWLETYRLAIK